MPRQFEFHGLAFRPFRFPVLLGTRKNITQIGGGRQARTAPSEGDRSYTLSMRWIRHVSASHLDSQSLPRGLSPRRCSRHRSHRDPGRSAPCCSV